MKADFDHVTDLNEAKKIIKKDENGQLITEPRNFLTSPMKKGQVPGRKGERIFLGEKIPYVEDPFDRKRELERKEREEHHKK